MMSIMYSLHLYNILHSINKDIIPSSNPNNEDLSWSSFNQFRHLALLGLFHLFSRLVLRKSDKLYICSVVAFGIALSLKN